MVMAAVAEAGEPIPPELVPFSKSPEETESLMDLAGESAYGVSVTGDLLLGIINALFQSPKDASLARAILRIKRMRRAESEAGQLGTSYARRAGSACAANR